MSEIATDPLPRWEIFCRVVDNYGDVGVCWRLARALVGGRGVGVRLWVDDWETLMRLCPQARCDGVTVAGVELRHWVEPFPREGPGDVVIEAFGCGLPASHVRAMAAKKRPPVWIDLEYLSAEDWVRGCHGLASPQANVALTKYFFFPGFTVGTGGLIRESRLFGRRDRVQVGRPRNEVFTVSLFGYEQPALAGLLHCWRTGSGPVCLLVPEGRALSGVNAALGAELTAGQSADFGALRVEALPFMDQEGYDEMLWRCDLNFVRGEDSFVRAQWAARPLVWHIYPQGDGAHFKKLDAFLALYCVGLAAPAAKALANFWHAWNGCGDPAAAWSGFARILPLLDVHARSWCENLGEQPSLVDALWGFCRHVVEKTG